MQSEWQPIEPPPEIPNFYFGTIGYDFEGWGGRFYPPDASMPRKLEFYQRYFSFLELNHTFEEEPDIALFSELERNSTETIQYAVKVHRSISHVRLPDVGSAVKLMKKHIHAVSPLVETGRFYSFLIQLDENTPRTQLRLDYLLAVAGEGISKKLDVHVEFRHISWHIEHVLQSLRDSGVGICNCEIPAGSAFPLKAYATSNKGYMRYHGLNSRNWRKGKPERHDYSYTEGEIESRVQGQIQLSRKVSATAVVYTNVLRCQAIANAIQNMRQLKQAFELSQMTRDGR